VYAYNPVVGVNKNNASGPFGPGVRNNANPTAIGPISGNAAGWGWR